MTASRSNARLPATAGRARKARAASPRTAPETTPQKARLRRPARASRREAGASDSASHQSEGMTPSTRAWRERRRASAAAKWRTALPSATRAGYGEARYATSAKHGSVRRMRHHARRGRRRARETRAKVRRPAPATQAEWADTSAEPRGRRAARADGALAIAAAERLSRGGSDEGEGAPAPVRARTAGPSPRARRRRTYVHPERQRRPGRSRAARPKTARRRR